MGNHAKAQYSLKIWLEAVTLSLFPAIAPDTGQITFTFPGLWCMRAQFKCHLLNDVCPSFNIKASLPFPCPSVSQAALPLSSLLAKIQNSRQHPEVETWIFTEHYGASKEHGSRFMENSMKKLLLLLLLSLATRGEKSPYKPQKSSIWFFPQKDWVKAVWICNVQHCKTLSTEVYKLLGMWER